MLQNDQRLLGEGDNLEFTVATLQEGTIVIPESAPGARALARPMIVTALGDAVTLADNNEVSNFDIDGQSTLTRAITAPVGGAGNPNLNHLSISNTVGDGIEFTPITITDTEDLDNDTNVTEQFVRGNVTISDVVFDNIGGDGIDINSFTATDVTLPTVTLQEAIAISTVTSTNGNGRGINIENTHTGAGHTTTLTGYTYDGGATSDGAIRLDNFDGTFTASASTLTNGATTGAGVELLGDSDGTMTFQSTVTFTSLDGTAFAIDGDVAGADEFGGDVTVAGTIVNDTGRSVSVQNITMGSAIAFNGNITDTGTGLLVDSNSGGSVSFVGDLEMTIDTLGATAVAVTDNTGGSVDFAGDVVIDATSTANGFVATGGGTLSAPGTVNSVSTETGRAVQITGMTIAGAGVVIDDVNRTAAAATNAIQLETNTGGPITIGNATDVVGDAGTIVGGTADAINIKDSANVSITGIKVNNSSAVSGVRVEKSNTTAMTVNLSDLEINDGDLGIEIVGGGTGAVTMTVNDSTINDSTDQGMSFDNFDVGTVTVNNAAIDGNNVNGTAGGVLISGSNGTVTFDSASRIREFGDTDFEVNGGTGTISFAGGIVNSTTTNPGDAAGRSVHVHDVTGGSVNFSAASNINDDNLGLLVQNNGAANISFLGTNTFTTTGDAVTVSNNDVGSNATVTFAGLNITTTGAGDGFIAELGGTLSVTGSTNQIDTENGVGLSITGMTIGSVDFAEVTVDGAAAANGMIFQNLTGGQVEIGTIGGADGSGGTIDTTGTAIEITNAQNVALRNIEIESNTIAIDINHQVAATTAMSVTIDGVDVNDATTLGMDLDTASTNAFTINVDNSTFAEEITMDLLGAGNFTMVFEDSSITTGNSDVALAMVFDAAFTDDDSDVTIQRNTFTTGDAAAFNLFADDATVKTITMLLDDNTFENASANAANDTAIFSVGGGTTLNATIFDNMFNNTVAAGDEFDMLADGASAEIQLNLSGNSANSGGGSGNGDFDLHNATGGTFDVFDKTNTFNDTRNDGTVVTDPNDAAFGDAAAAPPTPN